MKNKKEVFKINAMLVLVLVSSTVMRGLTVVVHVRRNDKFFHILTYASVHFNSHVPPSKPLFGPKTYEACSDVSL